MFVALALQLCLAATPDAGVPTGVLTRAPELLSFVEAAYPASLADAGVEGTVVMEVDVGADGLVSDARVTQSAGAEFDAAALEAVRKFTFSAAEVDNVPAAVRITYSYQFVFRPTVVTAADAGATAGAAAEFVLHVKERGSREPLVSASVTVGSGENAPTGVSDDQGTVTLSAIEPGVQQIRVSAPGYDTFKTTETFEAGTRIEATYFVRKNFYGKYEAVVRADKEKKEVASTTLHQEEIRLIPGTQGDAFKVVQNLPGVARSPFSLGLLIVRGSKPWDSKTYVDLAQVPLLFHFGGLFATFNSNLLEDLSFLPGNFGVDFGRNIGGIVNAQTRSPSHSGYHGYADINLIDASALVEGPISENWSFAASGRRSYIDVVLPWALKTFAPDASRALNFIVAPRYYDYQARLEWKPKDSAERFFVTFFGSDDKLKFALPNPTADPEGRGEFGTAINYNRLLFGYDLPAFSGGRFRQRLSLGLDNADFTLGSDLYFKTALYPVSSRTTFEFSPFDSLEVNAGLDMLVVPYVFDAQSPPPLKLNQIPDPYFSRQLVHERTTTFGVEPAAFVEATYRPIESLRIVAGVRADYESQMKKAWADPRLAVFYSPLDWLTVKAAAGLYHQPPDYRIGQLNKTFGNPDLAPEGAAHFMVGTELKISPAISLDIQGYHKRFFDQARATIAPPAGSTDTDVTDLKYTSIGYGRSYGLEVLLRHALTDRFFGWIAYSLSRTERDYFGGTEFSLGPFDQPHNLIVVASYKLPYDFIVGARMRFSSGPLDTPIVGAVYDANANYYFPLQGKPNSRRLPPFFQLDARIDKRFVFQSWMLSLYLDVQNMTNQRNVEGVANNFDYTKEQYIYGLPVIPSLGIRGEW